MPSIAIIGASKNKNKYGNKAVRAYKSQGWQVFPVNPHEKEIEGLKCYPKVTVIPEKVELASIYLLPEISLKLVPELKEKGIKKVYLNPGAESEELVEKLKKAGIQPLLACSILAIGINPEKL